MKIKFLSLLALSSALVFSGCKDDDNDSKPIETGPGKVAFQIDNVVGDSMLVFNSKTYTSPGSQQYTVSDFRYYISNFKFRNKESGQWTERKVYHYINHLSEATKTLTIDSIPAGVYDSLVFAVGIDSTRNHTGAQTGALDPANDMYWDWTIGYKFLQFEGKSPSSPQAINGLVYHIGHDQNFREVRLELPVNLVVSKNSAQHYLLTADVNKLFGTAASPILFDQVHTVMGLNNSTSLADNYAKMFSVTGIMQ